jgi:enhancer of polycomb-like protein
VRATDVKFNELYPKVFSEPATYIRFSSTVEDCTGVPYCMNEDDASFLAQLNEGKDVNGQPLKDKSKHCSEDTFEEVMNFFEEVSKREQPYANLGSAPILKLDEMEKANIGEEPLSSDARWFLSSIYEYWASRKGDRSLMPSIKVRVLDATSEADEADPYVCFRRREVRQTRKTRGRDAQVVEKLKKLRWELEQARALVESVKAREETTKLILENSRLLFNQRHSFKEVKVAKQIIGEKGDDEELLVNQKVRLPGFSRVYCNILTSTSPSSKQIALVAASNVQHSDSLARSAAAMLPRMISALWLKCRRRSKHT